MFELISHQVLSSTASSITFSSIPQNYTDLYLVASVRSSAASDDGLFFKFNNTTANTSWRNLLGFGSGTASQTGSGWLAGGGVLTGTASTFTNVAIYIPNYTSNVAKTATTDSVCEQNSSTGYQFMVSNLWNDTSAINRIDLYLQTASLTQYSSATLYGVNRTTAIGKPKAIGGNITYANGYWVHTFTGSGTFYPTQPLTVDALIVAGGGGGGDVGGGGGAGGVQYYNSLPASSAFAVSIGAGGSASNSGANGTSSSMLGLSTVGGGGGGGYQASGASGGSGGGGGSFNGAAGGAGTSGQGNNGGAGSVNGTSAARGAGGGGGAGATGSAGIYGGTGGAGGSGVPWNGTFYAGGGGGEGYYTGGTGGRGGGGNGGTNASPATAGAIGTGSGGGGSQSFTGHGGSGVVVIRYRAD